MTVDSIEEKENALQRAFKAKLCNVALKDDWLEVVTILLNCASKINKCWRDSI